MKIFALVTAFLGLVACSPAGKAPSNPVGAPSSVPPQPAVVKHEAEPQTRTSQPASASSSDPVTAVSGEHSDLAPNGGDRNVDHSQELVPEHEIASRQPNDQSPIFLDVVRDADGKPVEMSDSEARNYCIEHNAHLPSAYELAQLAMSFGAKGIMEKCLDSTCYKISARNENGSEDDFAYSPAGYSIQDVDVGRLWSSSRSADEIHDGKPFPKASIFSLNNHRYGMGNISTLFDVAYQHAVQCVKGPGVAPPQREPVKMAFTKIRAGSFTMGGTDAETRAYGGDPLRVRITKDFDIQTTVVTQLQWWEVMGTNPSKFAKKIHCPYVYVESGGVGLCSDFPLESVSWNQVQAFIQKLNSKDRNFSYRLPTEAEWEYATRAGTQTAYFWGNKAEGRNEHGRYEKFEDEYTWYAYNSGGHTQPVATKKANPWGLYDVSGNVLQWVQDCSFAQRGDGSSSVQIDPFNTSSPYPCNSFVVKGGDWRYDSAADSARRTAEPPDQIDGHIGFRLVRNVR